MKNVMKNNKGFTLVEMLIVMVIISVLVMLIIPNAGDILDSARETADDANAQTCESFIVANELNSSIVVPPICFEND